MCKHIALNNDYNAVVWPNEINSVVPIKSHDVPHFNFDFVI